MQTDALRDALDAENWHDAERSLLEKTLAEFMYEELLDPDREDGDGTEGGTRYELDFDGSAYRFVADERPMDSYRVREGSVERREGGTDWSPATDPVTFLLDARERLGTDEMTAGHLVREFRNTLLADAYLADRGTTAAELASMDYAELEGEMEGHPWITYNKGRIGWSHTDYERYAPERKRPVNLRWLAVRREASTVVSVDGLDFDGLLREELGDLYGAFEDDLLTRGHDPDHYTFVPVHEWQWENAIVDLFAKELAEDDLVPLGAGDDAYLPGQSVRTFFNVSDPAKHNVKLPMRILNTLVWRGLPGERTEAAPAVTEYVKRVRDEDPFLRDGCRLVLPGEVAGVNVDHPSFARLDGNAYQYDELLGAIWRESVVDLLDDGERPMTLATLLHVGSDGKPVVSELVERSPLELESWLDELFGSMLPPLLHYLYRYGTVFSPHGENAIVVLDADDVPTRLAVKDFVDDVNVSDRPLPELERLDDDLRAVLRSEPPEGLCQFVFCGLFVGVYRYLAGILAEHHDYPEERFWAQVREAILDYQARFPELEERFDLFDLLRPEFTKLALNRNRIVDEGYGDREGRPHASEYGTVSNPLHRPEE